MINEPHSPLAPPLNNAFTAGGGVCVRKVVFFHWAHPLHFFLSSFRTPLTKTIYHSISPPETTFPSPVLSRPTTIPPPLSTRYITLPLNQLNVSQAKMIILH